MAMNKNLVKLKGCSQATVRQELKSVLARQQNQPRRQIAREAEIHFLMRLVEEYWHKLSCCDQVSYFNGKGPDIVLQKGEETIAIEVKASKAGKDDYFNQNGCKYMLHGNCLKPKDVDLKTGLIVANFLVFAAELNAGFDLWLFTRDDLATLFPRSICFIPSFIPTLMMDAPKKGGNYGSHFTDEYNSFRKGVISIVLPTYDSEKGKWTKAYPPREKYHSFEKTWCPLIDAEHSEMAKVVLSKLEYRFDGNLVFKHQKGKSKNPNFGHRQCNYRNETSDEQCQRCKEIIGMLTTLAVDPCL